MFSTEINDLISNYVRAIEANNAAVFVGAGLSIPSGACNWKDLLRDCGNEINLDVDKEYDLTKLAQYYVNENGANKHKLVQHIINKLKPICIPTRNHEILASLPINTYWTTNYDTLIEDALKNNCKNVDVKKSPIDMSYTTPNRDVVVYKMHGDINTPNETVITKDDYDTYNKYHKLFTVKLCGDMVTRDFLFLGFGFEDHNLDHILTQLKQEQGANIRTHYCIMKKLSDSEFSNSQEFEYARIKLAYKVRDLKRYGINVVFVDKYDDITEILSNIRNRINRKHIFISGSAYEYGTFGQKKLENFVYKLSNTLIFNNYSIVSGYGLGIGSAVVSGAIEQIYAQRNKCKIEQKLLLRPFSLDPSVKEHWTRYREDMLSNAGVAIFVCGNKLDNSTKSVVEADGMIEEFEIANKLGVIPIPIPTTEYTAKKLWDIIMSDFNKYVSIPDLKSEYEDLENATDTEKIIDIITSIIDKLSKGE